MISPLLLILLLLMGSAFFSATETVIFSLSRAQIRRYQESKVWIVQQVGKLLEYPRDYLPTILLGNEMCNFSISMVAGVLIARLLILPPEQEIIASVVLITPFVLLCGEILPKNFALLVAPHIAPLFVPLIHVLHVFVTPVRRMLTFIADSVVRLFGGSPEQQHLLVLEQEFRQLVDLGTSHGVVGEEEREIIHNVFEFSDKTVRSIMVPKERLFMLHIGMPYERMLEQIQATEFRRIPLYDRDSDDVVGVLHVQSLFSLRHLQQPASLEQIRELLHEPLFVTPDEPLELLLRKIQQMRIHMALVRGQDGEILGAVTLHDVLETIFGEIENDEVSS